MTDPLSEEALTAIEGRVAAAREVANEPWETWLETAGGLGGESFVQFNVTAADADELYFRMCFGGQEVRGPDRRVDAVVDFLGHSLGDIRQLLAELHRLKHGGHSGVD